MMEPVRPVHRHNVQRPSIMEIYHKISEEEAKARAKEEEDRDRYAKRWSSGYKLLAEIQSRELKSPQIPDSSVSLQQDESLHESDIASPTRTSTRTSVSFTTSPPYSPPQEYQHGSSIYPMESSVYTAKQTIPRRPSYQLHASLSGLGHITANSKSEELVINEGTNNMHSNYQSEAQAPGSPGSNEQEQGTVQDELQESIHQLKQALVKPAVDDSKQGDDTIRQMLQLIKSNRITDNRLASLESDASENWSLGLRLEKVSFEDAVYAQRLDNIRQRLGSLVTGMDHDVKDTRPTTTTSTSKYNTWPRGITQYSGSPWLAICTAAWFISTCLIALHCMRFRAEYLWQYSYHDGLYPILHPLPTNVQAFLSPYVEYNVPFPVQN